MLNNWNIFPIRLSSKRFLWDMERIVAALIYLSCTCLALFIIFHYNTPQISFVYYIWIILTISLYFFIMFVTPGYVKDYQSDANIDALSTKFDLDLEKRKEQLEKLSKHHRFCVYCKILKPERSKHVYRENYGKCIVKFDHSCPFFGNDIGVYNHRFFNISL